MGKFEIYALQVGQGYLALSAEPTSDDLAEITAWSPDLIVSMVEIGTPITILGSDIWVHFPVQDYDVPPLASTPAWVDLADRAQKILNTGGRVLIHCRGGCGRSGMAVLRLMIGAGEPPDVALTRLRALRPCAVETPDQMLWAKLG